MIWVAVVCGIFSYQNRRKVRINDFIEHRSRKIWAIIPFAYIIFWTGMRNGFADTPAYIKTYEAIPTGGMNIVIEYARTVTNDTGFYFLSAMFKNYVSTDYHWWLFSMALISGVCVCYALYRHSDSFHFSTFLFMAMCLFSWMMNGVRQFLVVAILFACSEWLLDKKKFWKYIVLIAVLSTIHSSALFLIPICFIVRSAKPWSKEMMFFLTFVCVAMVFSERVTDVFVETIGKDYADTFYDNTGSGIMRTLVAAVPTVIAFVQRKEIERRNNPYINLCVNLSIVSLCVYIISSFTNGILVGRMATYFNIYNIILLPWLIKYCFRNQEKKILYVICIACYLFYFYYQTSIVGNFYYSSDFTGIIY